ncbi:hypothetical protein HDU67_004248 [Dinochytrium kinnereticum]|nr:hypothetical protein HDU67_004248 [Dinochytrium kinnereticum]
MMLSGRDMVSKELFGGAITISLPDRFVDASVLREVPDNQEVFIDTKGTDQSIIIELLEMLPAEDGVIPAADSAVVTCCLGQQAVSKFRETAAGSQNLVNVYLAVFRIPSKETDLLISFNHPISLGEKSSSLAGVDARDLMREGGDVLTQFRQIVDSVNIVYWGLFA